MNPFLFEFEDKYDHLIEKYIKKHSAESKVKVEARYIKAVLGARDLLSEGWLSEQDIDNAVKKFYTLLSELGIPTKVFANWDSRVEKVKGSYPNQVLVEKTLSVCRFYQYRDTEIDYERAEVEKKRIFGIRQREVRKNIPIVASAIAIGLVCFVFVGASQFK